MHDDVGVECAVSCVAHPTQKQYKWGAVNGVQCTLAQVGRYSEMLPGRNTNKLTGMTSDVLVGC